MNILILSSTNPVDIIEMGNLLYKHVDETNTDIFSIQTMAFLAEHSFEYKYVPAMWSFAKAFAEQRKSILRLKKNRNLICYGNLFTNTDIKFDYIVCYEPDAANGVNVFLDKSIELFNTSEDAKIKTLSNEQWYSKDKVQYTFSSIRHLLVFLKTLKVLKEDNNATQSETTVSSESSGT